MTPLSDAELIKARDLGAATYLSSYVHLMARNIGVDDSDDEGVNAMALQMVEAVNLGTEAAFRALMNDRSGMENALVQLRDALETLA